MPRNVVKGLPEAIPRLPMKPKDPSRDYHPGKNKRSLARVAAIRMEIAGKTI